MQFYAHSVENRDKADWQPLSEHLRAVGRCAAKRGDAFGMARAAELAGLLHDLGKYTRAFQRRLDGASIRVDHSTAGAREVVQLAKSPSASPKDRLIAELIAYAIAGHHAGLADKHGESGSLSDRLDESACRIEPLEPVWRDEVKVSASDLYPPDFDLRRDDPKRGAFQLGFLGRMIFSCLVDADFRDTEAFFARINNETKDRDWESLPDIIDRLRTRFDDHMAGLRGKGGDVNRLRTEILDHVRAKASLPPGIFTLNVPTGGGKTLASLGFALDHARAHGMRRIITAIPFTSVIDQTATIFRDVLGDGVVLEHHSAIEEERLPSWKGGDDWQHQGRNKLHLAMEDWAAPVVVTTNVQFFESLFANRPSRCRKLHNIANAVIVLDEAQTIPLPVLRPAVAALDELGRNYGCTIVLCTATQPALGAPEFAGGLDLDPERELAPDPKSLHRSLRRTSLRMAGEMADADLVGALSEHDQALVIVNSRAHALALYRAAEAAKLDGIIHLSTRQIAADRRAILADVKERLCKKHPCRLIATSLVEAGVDIDFPRVWRAEAGLDQIAQAAGRCNREGKRAAGDSIVTVFKPKDWNPPAEIKGLIGDFARMREKHADLFAPDAIRDYFGEVYWRKGEALDKHRVMEAFRMNRETPSGATDFAYRTVGENFRLIQSGLLPVIVAEADEPKRTVEALRLKRISPRAAARDLQSYVVQVPPRARDRLVQNGQARFIEGFGDQFTLLVTSNLYKDDVGLLWEDTEYLQLEQLLV